MAWVFYCEATNSRMISNELDAALMQSATVTEETMRLAEVKARLKRAAAGRLTPRDEIKPVHLNPDLWEIVWDFGGLSQLRMYHAEPGSHSLLALRLHWKRSSRATPPRPLPSRTLRCRWPQ